MAKKQRANDSQEELSTSEPTKKGGRTRRSLRSRQEEEKAKASIKPAAIPPTEDSVVIVDDLLLGEDDAKKGEVTNAAPDSVQSLHIVITFDAINYTECTMLLSPSSEFSIINCTNI